MKYYDEQTFNDRWIVEHVFKGKRNGFFIEAGACEGMGGSSTYTLELYLGWTGILVEPITVWFEHLVKNRPDSKCFNVCLYDENKEVDFVEFEKAQQGLSGIPENWESCWRPKLTKIVRPELVSHEYKKLKKTAITLEKLLEESKAPNVIDYLALDIEGAEPKVLEKFPFDKYRFKAISIEGPFGVRNILKQQGYFELSNPFASTNHEGYFIHEEFLNIEYKI